MMANLFMFTVLVLTVGPAIIGWSVIVLIARDWWRARRLSKNKLASLPFLHRD